MRRKQRKRFGQGGEKETTLTLLTDNENPPVLEALKAISAEFEKKYHIKTEIETRPGGRKAITWSKRVSLQEI
ncbi:hypothetical protein [Geobacillus sp. JS12]|uniref:hypothetical protein n=1 Tax=Geobacillus sp. JS12 TaxID=1813182 RepID=UPI001F229322|nr:hypothetical protein [Geobacillus sp. JS12]